MHHALQYSERGGGWTVNRMLLFGMLGGAAVGYFIGYTVNPTASALAQAPAAQGQAGAPSLQRPGTVPLAPDQPAKEQYWNIDELRKLHADRVAAAAAGQREPPFERMRSRTHEIMVMTRLYRDKPIPSNITKRLSQWDDAEQHEGMSDVYLIVGGSGTMVVGGEIEQREYRPAGRPGSFLLPGEFVGQPIRGGRAYKVKAGDIINIPPAIPHQPQPDPGGMTYFLIKVNVGLYPWSISR